MDLTTIKKNLKASKYSNVQEVLDDIQLIWDNCKKYNIEGSDIYKIAQHCEKNTKKIIEKVFKSGTTQNQGVNSSSQPLRKGRGGKDKFDSKEDSNEKSIYIR
jgi:hypothetical protein